MIITNILKSLLTHRIYLISPFYYPNLSEHQTYISTLQKLNRINMWIGSHDCATLYHDPVDFNSKLANVFSLSTGIVCHDWKLPMDSELVHAEPHSPCSQIKDFTFRLIFSG